MMAGATAPVERVARSPFDARGARLATVSHGCGMTGDADPHGVIMTRSSDRTLLQALGFNDPDKSNPEHDLGCRYLIQPEPMAKLVSMLHPNERAIGHQPFSWVGCSCGAVQCWRENVRVIGAEHEGAVEVVVQREGRGPGQGYHIGFLDAEIRPCWRFEADHRAERKPTEEELLAELGPQPPYVWSVQMDAARKAQHETYLAWHNAKAKAEKRRIGVEPTLVHTSSGCSVGAVGIEVKIGQVPVAQAIRQIKLYESYALQVKRWVLATRYPISQDDRDALKNEGIFHIRLAGGFDAYLEQLKQAPEADSPEL